MQATQQFRDVTMRCRAFRCEGIKLNTIRVYSDGSVWVWDECARHFTSNHRLGRAAVMRAKQQASA